MKKRRRWWTLAAVGLLATTGVYLRQDDARLAAPEGYETARITREDLSRTVIATGVIRPVVGAEIDVGSRISGRVVHLPVKVGDRVREGELLAELDRAELEAAVDQARAELSLARARLTAAESTYHRRQRLFDDGLLSREDLETARRDLDVEEARLELAEARLEAAGIALGYTRIRAPIRGVIAAVTTRGGETVAAGFSAPTFVTIVDLDRLEVRAYVDETDIGRIRLGQSAVFTVDTYPDAEFPATVTAIQPRAELRGSVVNYVVTLDFDDAGPYVLRPEMTAHVRLSIEERKGVLTAPRRALRHRDGRQYVVVEHAGEWQERKVRTGWRTDGSVEILDGLAEGEVVQLNPS